VLKHPVISFSLPDWQDPAKILQRSSFSDADRCLVYMIARFDSSA